MKTVLRLTRLDLAQYSTSSFSSSCNASWVIFQLRVEAYDMDSPPRTAIQLATVNVNRNLNKPTFVTPRELRAEISVTETESFEKVLYRVEGRDDDLKVGGSPLWLMVRVCAVTHFMIFRVLTMLFIMS